MALTWKNLTIPAGNISELEDIRGLVARRLGASPGDLKHVSLKKKSLDARKKKNIVYHCQVRIEAEDEDRFLSAYPHLERYPDQPSHNPVGDLSVSSLKYRHKPVIIGSGPAGTFAALCLREAGIPAVIVERGEPVGKRLKTVNKLRSGSEFNEESNFCFGEGGAGTFSDGKLTCGRNHPLIRYIFDQFLAFGGPENLAYDAHPHIGTDFLLKIAVNMRSSLESSECSYMFGRKFESVEDGGRNARHLVRLDDGTLLPTDHLILAIGHSARDTYRQLFDMGFAMAPKPFAMGARIEHPQDLIDEIQFGSCNILPAAEYKLTARSGARGIWTFCMCPGGHLMPTPAQAGHLAINGMSYHARNSGFANAAVVVNVLREDFYRGHVLDGMHFQAKLEREAFKWGGGNYHSPAQRLTDFLAKRNSKGSLSSTYKPGVVPGRLDKILPDFITGSLDAALKSYNSRMRGYISNDALIVGLESKTSAPVTLLRDKNLQSTSHKGIFPCGEGAGFAGGIISAALDGVRVGRAVVTDLLAEKGQGLNLH